MSLPTFERYLAITDVEATGLDWEINEIIEIGLVLARQPDLKIVEEFEVKVKPEHIETADPRSLEIAGYREEEWRNALPLKEAMALYADKARDAIFVAHPVVVDYSFIDRAFRKAGIPNPLHYQTLDPTSMAWILLRDEEKFPKITLTELAKYFELEQEPSPHRALNGARLAHQILRKLAEPKR